MKISVHATGFNLTPFIQNHVESQLNFHLRRLAHHISRIDVHLEDLNGPKGGQDMQALFNVKLSTRQVVTLARTGTDMYHVIDKTARLAKRAVRRSINKYRRVEKLSLKYLQYANSSLNHI